MLAEAPNRWAASMPATPSDVRCRTATRYVSSATPHTSQASRGILAVDVGAGRAGLTVASVSGPRPPRRRGARGPDLEATAAGRRGAVAAGASRGPQSPGQPPGLSGRAPQPA